MAMTFVSACDVSSSSFMRVDFEDECSPSFSCSSTRRLYKLESCAQLQARLKALKAPLSHSDEAIAIEVVRHVRARSSVNVLVVVQRNAIAMASKPLARAFDEVQSEVHKDGGIVLYHAFGDPAFHPSLARVLASFAVDVGNALRQRGVPMEAARASLRASRQADGASSNVRGWCELPRPWGTPPWTAFRSGDASLTFGDAACKLAEVVPVIVFIDNADYATLGGIDTAFRDCLPVDAPHALRIVIRVSGDTIPMALSSSRSAKRVRILESESSPIAERIDGIPRHVARAVAETRYGTDVAVASEALPDDVLARLTASCWPPCNSPSGALGIRAAGGAAVEANATASARRTVTDAIVAGSQSSARLHLWRMASSDRTRVLLSPVLGGVEGDVETAAELWDDVDARWDATTMLAEAVEQAVEENASGDGELAEECSRECPYCGAVTPLLLPRAPFCHACGERRGTVAARDAKARRRSLTAHDRIVELDRIIGAIKSGKASEGALTAFQAIKQSVRQSLIEQMTQQGGSGVPNATRRKAFNLLALALEAAGAAYEAALCLLASAGCALEIGGEYGQCRAANSSYEIIDEALVMIPKCQDLVSAAARRNETDSEASNPVMQSLRTAEGLRELADALDVSAELLVEIACEFSHRDEAPPDATHRGQRRCHIAKQARLCLDKSQELRHEYHKKVATLEFNVTSEFPYLRNACFSFVDGQAAKMRSARRIAHCLAMSSLTMGLRDWDHWKGARNVSHWFNRDFNGALVEDRTLLMLALEMHEQAIEVFKTCIEGLCLDVGIDIDETQADSGVDVVVDDDVCRGTSVSRSKSVSSEDKNCIAGVERSFCSHHLRLQMLLKSYISELVGLVGLGHISQPHANDFHLRQCRVLRNINEASAMLLDIAFNSANMVQLANELMLVDQACKSESFDRAFGHGFNNVYWGMEPVDHKFSFASIAGRSIVTSEAVNSFGQNFEEAELEKELQCAVQRFGEKQILYTVIERSAAVAKEAMDLHQSCSDCISTALGQSNSQVQARVDAPSFYECARVNRCLQDQLSEIEFHLKVLQCGRMMRSGAGANGERFSASILESQSLYALGIGCIEKREWRLAQYLLNKATLAFAQVHGSDTFRHVCGDHLECASVFAERQVQTVRLLLSNSWVCYADSRFADAEVMLWRCLKMCGKISPQVRKDLHVIRAEALQLLTYCLIRLGRLDEAKECAFRTMDSANMDPFQSSPGNASALDSTMKLAFFTKSSSQNGESSLRHAIYIYGAPVTIVHTQHVVAMIHESKKERSSSIESLRRAVDAAYEIASCFHFRPKGDPQVPTRSKLHVDNSVLEFVSVAAEAFVIAPSLTKLGRSLAQCELASIGRMIRPTLNASRNEIEEGLQYHRQASNATLRYINVRLTLSQKAIATIQNSLRWAAETNDVQAAVLGAYRRWANAFQDLVCDHIIDTAFAIAAISPEVCQDENTKPSVGAPYSGRTSSPNLQSTSCELAEALELMFIAFESSLTRYDVSERFFADLKTRDGGEIMAMYPLLAVRRAYIGRIYLLQRRYGDALRVMSSSYEALKQSRASLDVDGITETILAIERWLVETRACLRTTTRLQQHASADPRVNHECGEYDMNSLAAISCMRKELVFAGRFRPEALLTLWDRCVRRLPKPIAEQYLHCGRAGTGCTIRCSRKQIYDSLCVDGILVDMRYGRLVERYLSGWNTSNVYSRNMADAVLQVLVLCER